MRIPIRKKARFLLLPVIIFTFLFADHVSSSTGPVKAVKKASPTVNATSNTLMVYDSLQLNGLGLSQKAFTYGVQGFQYLLQQGRLKNDSVIAIVDFSLPSNQKRLFVIDVKNARLLFNTLVSHGRNSGKLNATSFSNKLNSYKTSLGFYITDNTYIGEHGLSLRLKGTEKGINDNAMSRAIVMHGADYVNEDLINSQGYIGRSLGCPAIPVSVHREIINTISNGACLFLYGANKNYITSSKILKEPGRSIAMSTPVM
ncbi:murein L,D-transpeptidase catalytic domain family protein [uncultured Chitinophaga sp.]|jgi:hypothetical protein|uniref:murein L,D-transpeptidase catalytic domain family protein n=1 Tax=uncultured Chitinophaga sp. TaxID=339340 RepID=UPI002638C1A4|nr:murein L,D-transpeptidase catalytic domain family protein [uncultured Chitinophaga sp.]